MANKKQIQLIIITVLISVFVTLAIVFTAAFFIHSSHNSYDENYITVSLIQLIATPEKFDGKFVRVIGVGNIEFEGDYIAIDKEAYDNHTADRIWIDLDPDAVSYDEAAQYNGEYVIVEGIFDKDDRGHMSLFQGAIKDVDRYDIWRLSEDTTE